MGATQNSFSRLAKRRSVAERDWLRDERLRSDAKNQAKYHDQQVVRGRPMNHPLNSMLLGLAKIFLEITDYADDWVALPGSSRSLFTKFASAILLNWFPDDISQTKLADRYSGLKKSVVGKRVQKIRHFQPLIIKFKSLSFPIQAESPVFSSLPVSTSSTDAGTELCAPGRLPKSGPLTTIDAKGRRRKRKFGRYRPPVGPSRS